MLFNKIKGIKKKLLKTVYFIYWRFAFAAIFDM